MDVHQVTSRAVHDGPDDDIGPPEDSQNEHLYEKENGLEKQTTVASTASYSHTYPEGGLQAWVVVAGSWFSLFASLGLMNSIALFQAYVLTHQLKGYNEGTVGWIFSIYTFLAFGCGVFIGPVFDKYGPRWLVIAGTICIVAGVLGMSFCTELYQFILAFGVLSGVGTSLLFTPAIATVGHWFKARRGFATGVASTAGGLGGIIFPLMQTELFEKIGYGWTTRIVALISLCCCLVGIVLLRSRLPPAKNATALPDFRIFRNLAFLYTTIGIFLLEFSLFIPLSYISTYAVHEGFSQDFAYQLIPIMNAGSVFGRLLPGYYADIIGPFNTCIGSVLVAMISCLGVWLPAGHTKGGIIVFSVLFGFSSGTSIAIAPVCIGRLCKTQEYGRYYATAYTIVSFACLIGIPIAGNLVQANGGDYLGLILCTSLVYVLSMGFLFWAKAASLGWRNWLAVY